MNLKLIFFLLVIPYPLFATTETSQASTELSYIKDTGNSDIEEFGIRNKGRYAVSKFVINGKLDMTRYKTKDVVTSEDYYVGEKIDWTYNNTDYIFQLANWQKDKFKNLDSRLTLGIGMGQKLFQGLLVELGGQYSTESHVNGTVNQFGSVRAFTRFGKHFNANTFFEQNLEYIREFDDAEGFRINSETSILTKINSRFELKTSYAINYDSDPGGKVSRKDTSIRIGLVINIK